MTLMTKYGNTSTLLLDMAKELSKTKKILFIALEMPDKKTMKIPQTVKDN